MKKGSIFDWIFKGAFFLLIVLVPLFFTFKLTTYTLPKVVIAQILVCVLWAAWLLKMTLEGRFSFRRSMLGYPIFIYFIISVSSLTYALSVPGGVTLLWQIFAYVMVYFIVIHHIPEEKIETWAFLLSLVGIVFSGYGVMQYFGFEPLLKGYSYAPYLPFSTVGHRNQAAEYLILLIPLAGVFFFLSPSRIRRLAFGIGTLLMTYHLFLTKSRGGLLGFSLSGLFIGILVIYKWLERYPFFYRRRRPVLISFFSFLIFVVLILFVFPRTLTLSVKHINPSGYYIHSIDGSKIPAGRPIRVEFDYRVLEGNPEKAGFVNLCGERTNSPPLYVNGTQGGWKHVRREDITFSSTPYDEDLKLRWMPGSDYSALQLKNVVVETKDGLNLIKDSFPNQVFSRVGVAEIDKTFSGQTRLYLYRNTIEMIKENLFLGSGFGNFKYVYPRYRDRGEWTLSGLNTRVEQAHNEYLQILSEVGIIGFLVFAWILFMVGRMSFQMIRKEDFDRPFLVASALTMGILATLLQSLFDFNLQNPASGVTFWMAVGFLEVVYFSAGKARGQTAAPPVSFSIGSKVLRGGIALTVLACLAVGIFFSVRPAVGDYYLKWGRYLADSSDWEGAGWCFERAKDFSPHHFDVYFNLGQTRERLKDYEGAAEAYRTCISLHPYFIEARNNLGAVYIKLGQLDEAIEEFKGAIEINPYYPGLHNNVGYLYSKRNLFKKALEEYQEVLELDPENAEVHKNLGLLYFDKLKDYAKAREYWERYLVLNPNDPQNDMIRKKIEETKK